MILLLRVALRWATYAYLLLLGVLLLALHWYGERSWVLSLVLYAPAPAVLAPIGLLAPGAVLFGAWRALLAQAVAVGAVFLLYMTYAWGPPAGAGPAELTLLTHNIGEGHRGEIAANLAQYHADVVLLQDANRRAPEFARLLPGMQQAAQGEFLCFARFPIVASSVTLLSTPASKVRPVAARFELQLPDRKIALYSVHLPTPRPHFQAFFSKRPWVGFRGYRGFLAERMELNRELAGILSREPLPVVAAGDFNTPDHGYSYHRYTAFFTDVFAQCGRRWGFTFPGNSGNPVTRGPWLRLDYVWAGRGWQALAAEVTTGRLCQHRALVAQLRWTGHPSAPEKK